MYMRPRQEWKQDYRANRRGAVNDLNVANVLKVNIALRCERKLPEEKLRKAEIVCAFHNRWTIDGEIVECAIIKRHQWLHRSSRRMTRATCGIYDVTCNILIWRKAKFKFRQFELCDIQRSDNIKIIATLVFATTVHSPNVAWRR